ncbi:PREDICTED: uncharacterized protein LOC107166887 [Diuraphis noxia]|uniref:uncharacterized protein LOC107166887 n=1 Tax=Diuraphis noxia TaxID=143948 RepID=UPI0007638A97|nr:PREDICTED: uncharacterized protein LOC107166887 [Diuraphis noxia]
MVEVDSEEVKRHLEILGYTNIEPNLLNEFIKDLKKVIEYDRKHNNVSVLSMSLYQDWNQTYSERMKNSTPIKNTIDRNNGTANGDEYEDEVDLISTFLVENGLARTKRPFTTLRYGIRL